MKRFDVMQALSGALYALAVTFGALMCPVTAFQIPVDPLPLFLTCAALCLLFAVRFSLRRKESLHVFLPPTRLGRSFPCRMGSRWRRQPTHFWFFRQ